MKWIKCSEELPENEQKVLIYNIVDYTYDYDIATYNKERNIFNSETTDGCCREAQTNLEETIFWCEIPKLTKD